MNILGAMCYCVIVTARLQRVNISSIQLLHVIISMDYRTHLVYITYNNSNNNYLYSALSCVTQSAVTQNN